MKHPNLSTHAEIAPEKDELYKNKIGDKYKELKESRIVTSKIEAEIRRLRKLESKRKGLEPAYINKDHLICIIEDLLLTTQSPVSKAFDRHQRNNGECASWAKRTIRYPVAKSELAEAIDCLLTNPRLRLMNQYGILDTKSIIKSDSYSEALNKMKKQQDMALRLQEKDDQLAAKDKAISDRDREIERLKNDLLRNRSKDWQREAIHLKKSGETVTNIARLLGKSRGTISTYLSTPDVKLLFSETI